MSWTGKVGVDVLGEGVSKVIFLDVDGVLRGTVLKGKHIKGAVDTLSIKEV